MSSRGLVNPDYVVQAAVVKYATNVSSIYGALERDIKKFWSSGLLTALRIDPPTEVGRYVVDVEVKEIYNDGSDPKVVEINTLHSRPQEKTYRLSQSKHEIFGANMSVAVSPEFFQIIPIRLTGSTNYYEGTTLQLANKGYGTATKVEVPPKSKVTATITTRAIAYQADTLVRVSFLRFSSILIKRRVETCMNFFCCLDGAPTTGELTPRELLANNGVEDIQSTDTRIYFNEPRSLSYTGEVVEMRLSEPVSMAPLL